MIPALLFVHAGLGVVLLATSWLPRRSRAAVLVGAAACGVAAALALAAAGASADRWRSLEPDPGRCLALGAGIGLAWLLIALLDRAQGRWEAGALVGIASSAAGIAVLNRWVVVGLVFWTCSSLALGALLAREPRHAGALAALFLSDALLVAGLGAYALDGGRWAMPDSFTGATGYLVLAALVVRSGAVPRGGVWEVLGSPAGVVLPLLAGSGLAMMAGRVPAAAGWPAAALVAGATAGAVASLLARAPVLSLAGSYPILLLWGITLAAPSAAGGAGVAAALTAAVVALWPGSGGRAGWTRALALSFVPGCAGFAALVAAARAAFGRTAVAEGIAAAAPWALLAAVLPAALAASVGVAARAIGAPEQPGRERARTAALWVLGALGIVVGVAPLLTRRLDALPVWGSGRAGLLAGLALAAGAIAAAIASARHRASEGPLGAGVPFEPGILRARPGRLVTGLAVAAATVSVVAVAALTVRGLQLGFL